MHSATAKEAGFVALGGMSERRVGRSLFPGNETRNKAGATCDVRPIVARKFSGLDSSCHIARTAGKCRPEHPWY